MVADPRRWYGRIIIRNESEDPIAIREEADASNLEKNINEIFTGIMIAENEFLKKGLKRAFEKQQGWRILPNRFG